MEIQVQVETNLGLFFEAATSDSRTAAFAKEQTELSHTGMLYLCSRFENLLLFGEVVFQEILTAIGEEEALENKLKVGKHLMSEWLRARKPVMGSFRLFADLEYAAATKFRESFIERCQEAMYYLHEPETLTPGS